MGWCDDVNAKLKYNKLVNIKENFRYEKLLEERLQIRSSDTN